MTADSLFQSTLILWLVFLALGKWNGKTPDVSVVVGKIIGVGFYLCIELPFAVIKYLVLKILNYLFPSSPSNMFMSWWEAWHTGLLRTSNDGIKLDGSRAITRDMSFRHILTIAPSGSGKSSCLFLPNLLTIDNNFSILVSDPSSELFKHSATSLMKRGYRVLALRPANYACSLRFNPLKRAGNDFTALKKVAKILIETTYSETKGDSAFWSQGAEAIIFLLMKLLATQPDSRYRNLANVRYLATVFSGCHASDDGGALGVLASRYLDDISFRDFLAMLSEDERTFSGRLSSAITALDGFSEPSVALMTASDNVDLSEFRKVKTALFWILPTGADTRFYKPLQTIFLSQFFDEMLKSDGFHDVAVFLDELGNLGPVPALGEILSVSRKFKVSIVAALQSVAQLQAVYGPHESQVILDNFNTKIYYPALPLNAARELSAILGKHEVADETVEGRKTKKITDVMSASEIRQMQGEIAIIANRSPIKLNSRPWFKDSRLKKLGLLPPPEITAMGKSSVEKVEFIPLPSKDNITPSEDNNRQANEQ